MTNLPDTDKLILTLLDKTEELIHLDKFEDAEYFLSQIEKHKPGDLNVPFQRGTMFMKQKEYEKALKQFLIVQEKLPDFFANVNNIGAAYYKMHRYNSAIDYFKRALEIKPDTDFVLAILAEALFRRGNHEESHSYFKRAIEISPTMFRTHSDMLLGVLYSDMFSPEYIKAEAEKFGENITKEVRVNTEFSNDKNPDRKLKIGYLSADFRDHPIPYFLESLFKNHDREKFEIHVYSTTLFDNPILQRLKKPVEHWKDVHTLSDEKICAEIIEDKIDILLDLAGHTAYNHLKVFAQRAAPIQASWVGYPGTTGLKTMDYKITDPHLEHAGYEDGNTEELWRLPKIFCCYTPHEKSPAVIDHPPFEDNGYVTFGCFNNFAKVGDNVLKGWAEILLQVTDARLFIEIDGIQEDSFKASVESRMKAQGMPMGRVILEPRKRENQFALYNKVDIALDPFPANGGTTSMDTLWMGVPFVTLAGRHYIGRMGKSILTNAGLPELIAQSSEEYVSIAVNLAKDKDRLRRIRHNLRDRFSNSPAMDAPAFTKDMEEAYRGMWKKYCGASS